MRCAWNDIDRCATCRPGPLSAWAAAIAPAAPTVPFSRFPRPFHAGETIYAMGEAPKALYCVSQGLVGLRMLHPDGFSVIVEIGGAGDLIGTRAILRDQPHRTAAEALTEVELCVLPRPVARRLLAAEPGLHQRLVERCLVSLDTAQDAMLEAAAMSNLDRLERLLRRIVAHCARSAGDAAGTSAGRCEAVRLPLSREDLAGMLGVRQETLSRLLRRLKDDGVLQVSGRHLVLCRPVGEGAAQPTCRAPAAGRI